MLAETHVGYDKRVSVEDFQYFPVCRARSANNRYYGGLAILTRLALRPYISFLKTNTTEYQWMKLPTLDKNFFNFQRDLFLCLTYLPPGQSTYANNMQQDLLDSLEKDISLYKTKGEVMICGDLNARTGSEPGFIINDGSDHLPLYQNYSIDNSSVPRHSKDIIVDKRGINLIDICVGNQVLMADVLVACLGNTFALHLMAAVLWTTHLCLNLFLIRYFFFMFLILLPR